MVRNKKHIPTPDSPPQTPRKKAEERLRQQNAALLDLVKIVTGDDLPWTQALSRIIETSARTLAVERTSVWMYTEDRAAIRCIDLFELKENRHSAGLQLGIDRYPNYFGALEEERIIAAHDAHLDPRTEEFSATYLKPLGISSMLDAPIRWRGKIVGLICHEHTGPQRYWSAEEQQFAASIADVIALAMETVERKRTEEVLQNNERKYRSIFQLAAVSIWDEDFSGVRAAIDELKAEGVTDFPEYFRQHPEFVQRAMGTIRVLDVNDATVTMFEAADKEELLGSLPKIFIAESIPVFIGELIAVAEGRKYFEAEARLSTVRGNPIDAFFNMVLSESPEGLRALFSVFDITQRKRAEESVRHYAEEILRSNKDLEQFAYIASHDLQEPLRIVSNYAEILKLKYKDKFDEKGQKFADNIIDNIYRMQELINDLLSYSSLGREKQFREIDMQKVCHQVTKNLALLIKETHAQVSCQELPKIMGDEIQMIQLLQNLVSNAIKFRSPERAPRVEIAGRSEGGEWILSVKDNGIGIPAEYHNRIFEIFKRLHNRHEYPGTGIGLAICKKIIDSHQGRIWVESVQGEGTTFFIAIPKEMTRRSFGKPSQKNLSK